VQLEGLGQLKISNDLIGNRTLDLPASNILPLPTTLPGGKGKEGNGTTLTYSNTENEMQGDMNETRNT
jgi:hypothetical protein